MRFLMIVKASKESEAGVMPTEQELAEMAKYNEQLVKAGEMLDGAGLHPSREGVRVNFDTGKWDVRPGEQGKLDKSLQLISDAVGKYGHLAEIKLFIAGHTDSVGTPDSNRTLSDNRARAIGQYFRKRGLRIPVLYEGFGEFALKKATGDEMDEPQNRRAEYILSIETPKIENARVEASWSKL